ncbi:hypothetical protein GCM10008938_41520 [Deinococcus roseus]|uniref:DUF4377 domain-containing protein n=2 Tax=Deinococcus roseus TaxID=392414 RepID=A0ABQ2DA12_9DEIO|nr:hypothetical protein GCM10008938_41520 [Deinococcus roseus]
MVGALLLSPLAFAQDPTEGEWTLLISGNFGKFQELVPAPTLKIQGKQLSGFSGCNRYSGSLSLKSNSIKLGQLVSTKMACETRPQKTEQVFMKSLQGAVRYQINNNTLILYTKGSGMMVFTRNPEQKMEAKAAPAGGLPKTENKIEAKNLKPEALVQPADTQVLFVAPKKVDCTGAAPMKCLQVRSPDKKDWEFFYSGIEGFNYEEGFNYKIRIRTEDVKNPPADASSKRYILVEVLEKTPAK